MVIFYTSKFSEVVEMRYKFFFLILVCFTICISSANVSHAITWEKVLTSSEFRFYDFIEYKGKLFTSSQNSTAVLYESSDGIGWNIITVGFGDPMNGGICSLCVFKGKLYAATYNEDGAQVWESDDGIMFSKVVDRGFGEPDNSTIGILKTYESSDAEFLYAGVGNEITGAKIFRSNDGIVWNPVISDGFGKPAKNTFISDFCEFKNYFYASIYNGEIWRSDDGIRWNSVVTDGLGYVDRPFTAFGVLGNWLYIGSDSGDPEPQIWRTFAGTSWSSCTSIGFDWTNWGCIPELSVPGKLYAGTVKMSGGEVWSSVNGTTWIKENVSGFGNPENAIIQSMHLFSLDNRIYAGTASFSGAEIWRTVDPITIVNFPSKNILIPLLMFSFSIVFIIANKVFLF